MAERTQESSNDCWPRSSDAIMFNLGYIRAQNTQILAMLTVMRTAPPKNPSGQPTLRQQIRDWADGIETLNRLWQVYRWPLGIIGWGLIAFLTWLGVF